MRNFESQNDRAIFSENVENIFGEGIQEDIIDKSDTNTHQRFDPSSRGMIQSRKKIYFTPDVRASINNLERTRRVGINI
jgi:hypothetical protein